MASTHDLVYSSHGLHHVEALEHLFSQVRQAMLPSGLLFFDDFIGPSRMQWTDEQMEWMERMLEAIPHSKRWDRLHGRPKVVERVPVATYLQADPSEAVRSAEIMPCLRREFDIVEFLPYGSALGYQVLQGIVHSFDPASPRDNLILDEVWRMDQQALERGVCQGFAVVAARPLP